MPAERRAATPPTPPPPPPRSPSQPSAVRQPPWLWIGLAVVVVIAAAIAVAGTRNSRDAVATPGLHQTQPVEVAGNPLGRLPDAGTADPAIGTTAPELRGMSFDGTAVAVTHDGRPKLVLFVAHWCPHCQREVPLLVDHLASTPLPDGIDLVTVATATGSDRPNYPPSAWLQRVGWPFPTLADSADDTAASAYGLPAYPYFVALDADGKVVARTSGEIPTAAFDDIVQQALG